MAPHPYDSFHADGGAALNSWADIQAKVLLRVSSASILMREAQAIRDRYNGDVVFPLTDVRGEPLFPSTSPAVIADSIDYVAMRAGGSRPAITVPAEDWADEKSRERASTARRALYARWHDSALHDVVLRRAYRHMTGYGTAALVVVPDFKMECARVELRDPLGCYPEYRSPDDVREPLDVAFVYTMSSTRLRQLYPEAADVLNASAKRDESWDVVEWVDEDSIVVGLLGRRFDIDTWYRTGSALDRPVAGQLLRRYRNRAGYCTAAVPRRVTLDRVMGLVTPILGSTDLMDKLMALEVAAAEKAVFPDMVVVGQNGRDPRLISGNWKDGRTGEPNLISDGAAAFLTTQPGPATQLVVDRLERRARVHTGLIPQAGGETVGALRTGRAVDAIGGLSLDPRIQESQELMARALVCVNESIGRVEKGYWPRKKMVAFSGWPSDFGHVTYVPGDVFRDNHNVVTYSLPGVDVAQASVALPQLVGAGLMSQRTARSKHPFIEDPEAEEKSILEERMNETVFTSMMQQAQAGALPLIDVANLADALGVSTHLVKAIMSADEAARARQSAPPETAEGEPPEPGQVAPNQTPGLSTPGMGAETMVPSAPGPIPGPVPAQERLQQLARALTQSAPGQLRGRP